MTDDQLPDAEYLRECFDYDSVTGVLQWKERPVCHFSDGRQSAEWRAKKLNARCTGKPFGARNTHGHIRGSLDGRRLYAHRIIWKMVHGCDPNIIDHKNGNPGDNRMSNLRNGLQADNQRNMKLSAANTSGVQGVSWHKQNGGWVAKINTPKGILSKYSKSRDAAIAWRQEMEGKHGYSGRARQ